MLLHVRVHSITQLRHYLKTCPHNLAIVSRVVEPHARASCAILAHCCAPMLARLNASRSLAPAPRARVPIATHARMPIAPHASVPTTPQACASIALMHLRDATCTTYACPCVRCLTLLTPMPHRTLCCHALANLSDLPCFRACHKHSHVAARTRNKAPSQATTVGPHDSQW